MKDKHILLPNWKVPSNVKALCTTRGFSHDIQDYSNFQEEKDLQDFNLANNCAEQSNSVIRNRELLSKLVPYPIAWLRQNHTANVVNVQSARQLQTADASWTTLSGIALAILTADCVPIVLASVYGAKIAAIHVGWRGLLSGVIQNTLEQMVIDTEFVAWIGPSIRQENFEVGIEVAKGFISQNKNFAKYVKSLSNTRTTSSNKKYKISLQEIARSILLQKGIKQVFDCGICTYDDERFYSYRRDNTTGRFATIIWLE